MSDFSNEAEHITIFRNEHIYNIIRLFFLCETPRQASYTGEIKCWPEFYSHFPIYQLHIAVSSVRITCWTKSLIPLALYL